MKNNGKKIVFSLATTMLLASSVGHAQSFNYRSTNNYTSYNRTRIYTINYNYANNYSNRNIIKYLPSNYSWNISNNIQTETPNSEEKTNTKININEENNNTVDNNNKNYTIPEANNSIEMEIVNLVNIERQKQGLAPLSFSEELSKVARMKSQDMANNKYFSHNSPTYGDPFTMMKSFGIQYKTAGENIAKGYSSAQSVMNGWMNSSGHRANILNSSFGKIGVGFVNVNGTTYWTQMFTN
jgi:uncharacterized YkwD family protein